MSLQMKNHVSIRPSAPVPLSMTRNDHPRLEVDLDRLCSRNRAVCYVKLITQSSFKHIRSHDQG